MKRLVCVVLIVLQIAVPVCATPIRWVDFKVPYESLKYAMDMDIESYEKDNHISWIDILAVAACRTGGRCGLSSVKKATAELLESRSPEEILDSLYQYYSYYHNAYRAALGGLLGSYAVELDDELKHTYGLKAYSPIAAGFGYSHCSDFGNSRSFGFSRKHLGNDLMGGLGTPIVAVEGGIIEALGWNRYGGWRVGIRSFDSQRYYYYAHLQKDQPFAPGLQVGDVVQAGDLIGFMGRTGYSDKENVNNIETVHLHFGLQLVFDEGQKECLSEIWIDVYDIVRLLADHRSSVVKRDGNWQRAYPFVDMDISEYPRSDFLCNFQGEIMPQGLTKVTAVWYTYSDKITREDSLMMSANVKLKSVCCDMDAIFSSGSPLMESLSPFNASEYVVFPGFCDVHVHFREPGFSYKETMKTGSMASARGGYTAVCTMPNLNPVPDSVDHLNVQLELIEKGSVIHVYPYGAITVGEQGEELADLEGMAQKVIAFSDDGKGVQSDSVMRTAMLQAKALNKMIVAHCEVNDLLFGGYIHDGEYAKTHGHKGICSASEYEQIARDLYLAEETGCKYHVCHISTKESVDLIRKAKAKGVDVTCETAPHYLIMNDSQLQEDGRFRMNPPIRSEKDRIALVEGMLDGTIDMIATDHAPHSAEEKSKGLAGSAFGIVGIETAFSAMYTHFVVPGIISLEKLIELLAINPRQRFGIPMGNDFTVWNLNKEFIVDPSDFLSMGKATPFIGWKMLGECVLTVCDGQVVYRK